MENSTETYSEALAAYVTKKVTLKEYFNKHIVGLKQNISRIDSDNASTCCPFHDETKPSMRYWGSTDTCYCFGCGVGGDLIAIHRKKRELYDNSFINRLQATQEIIRLYGLEDDEQVKTYLSYITQGLIKDKEDIFKTARRKLTSPEALAIDPSAVTVTRFRNIQDRINSQSISLKNKCKQFTDLDIQAGLYLQTKNKK